METGVLKADQTTLQPFTFCLYEARKEAGEMEELCGYFLANQEI